MSLDTYLLRWVWKLHVSVSDGTGDEGHFCFLQ